MGFKDLNIQLSYAGKGDTILRNFLLPVIEEAISYDRITSFFTIEALLAISQGIDSIYQKQGKIRLIIGIHSLPMELIEASLQREYLREKIAEIRIELNKGIALLSDELKKDRLATLAWMIEDGLLEIKAAAVKGPGLFHPKTLLLKDAFGEKIVAVGSPNETDSGLGGNFEQIMVATSWNSSDSVSVQEKFFNTLWNNRASDALVMDISEDTAATIISSLGKEYISRHNNNSLPANKVEIIENSSKMLANFFVSGNIPSLYLHQERAVIKALSRWPVRVLFSDEVGLGKTFEVAATMKFLTMYCGIKRVVILTPKSILKQWQNELFENFKINAWLFDSTLRTYIDNNGNRIPVGKKESVLKKAPDIVLISSQYARGNKNNIDIFSYEDTIFPDLLIVDEAHSARVSTSFNGEKKKTQIYGMLERVSSRIPHILLATATPMQKDADEYLAILNLIGLPKAWQKPVNFNNSLKWIASKDAPDKSESYDAAALLIKTLDCMSPDISKLNKDELELISELKKLIVSTIPYDVGLFVIKKWNIFRSILVKLHPANLLTIRNTRSSLIKMGYKFPKRNPIEVSVEASMGAQLFYDKIYEYLYNDCFTVEKVLYPKKQINLVLVRDSYRQRISSSIYSCMKSLERRNQKLLKLKDLVFNKNDINNISGFDFNLDFDYISLCELLDDDLDYAEQSLAKNIDKDELKRVISNECTALESLINQSKALLGKNEDLKIVESIKLVKHCLLNNDLVLVFSRYTDTIDALLLEFKRLGYDNCFKYGIYTGQKSVIVDHGEENECNKDTLKKALFSKDIKLVFCSDAASEGLNLQAARVLINVDVPWTPARLEQRIGRIARLGQTANEVDIYNVWYPDSIEAKMYKKIQSRFEETNIVIGEFPVIIAKKILTAILNNEEFNDNGLNDLNNIRRSYQILELEELRNRFGNKTESETIRRNLLDICKNNFPITNQYHNGEIIKFKLPDGSSAELTAEAGMQESISLNASPWKHLKLFNKNVNVVKNSCGEPIAFAYKNQLISHESVFRIFLNEELKDWDYLQIDECPKTIPNHKNLNLGYALSKKPPEPPTYWQNPEDFL